jgi:hypothetical protein
VVRNADQPVRPRHPLHQLIQERDRAHIKLRTIILEILYDCIRPLARLIHLVLTCYTISHGIPYHPLSSFGRLRQTQAQTQRWLRTPRHMPCYQQTPRNTSDSPKFVKVHAVQVGREMYCPCRLRRIQVYPYCRYLKSGHFKRRYDGEIDQPLPRAVASEPTIPNCIAFHSKLSYPKHNP